MNNSKLFRAGSIAAIVAWCAGIGTVLVTRGIVVQGSELVEPRSKIAALISNHAEIVLRFMALDTLFVIGYVTVFAVLFLSVAPENRLIAGIGIGAGLVGALADTFENLFYITYATAALNGNSVEPVLPFHYFASMLKWLGAFSALGFFALVFPTRTTFERILVILMCTFPLGGALSIASPQFFLMRALFFVVGFPLFAVYFWQLAKNSESAK